MDKKYEVNKDELINLSAKTVSALMDEIDDFSVILSLLKYSSILADVLFADKAEDTTIEAQVVNASLQDLEDAHLFAYITSLLGTSDISSFHAGSVTIKQVIIDRFFSDAIDAEALIMKAASNE